MQRAHFMDKLEIYFFFFLIISFFEIVICIQLITEFRLRYMYKLLYNILDQYYVITFLGIYYAMKSTERNGRKKRN